MSDYHTIQSLNYNSSNYKSSNYKSSKFSAASNSAEITDIYSTGGVPPPSNYQGCFTTTNVIAGAPTTTSSVSDCKNTADKNQYPFFGMSNYSSTSTSGSTAQCNYVSSFSAGSPLCVQGDDGNYYGTGSAMAVYSKE